MNGASKWPEKKLLSDQTSVAARITLVQSKSTQARVNIPGACDPAPAQCSAVGVQMRRW